MKNFLRLLTILSFIFYISCSSGGKQKNTNAPSETIEIDMTASTNDKVLIDNLLKVKSVIHLESTKGSFIKEASVVRVVKDKIYVLDSKQTKLFIFNKEGEFISQILSSGKGPGEIIEAYSFDIDIKNKRILVLDSSRKGLLVFDLLGEYQNTIEIGCHAHKMAVLDSDNYCFYIGYYDDSYHNFHIISADGHRKKMLFPFPQDIAGMAFNFTGHVTRNNHGVLYTDACSNEIYQIDKEGVSFLRYKIDFGPNNWPEKRRHEHMAFFTELNKFELKFLQSPYEENEEGLIFPYLSGNTVGRAFYLKETGTVYHVNNGLVKDVFYQVLSNPKGVTSDGFFISVLHPFPIKEKLLDEIQKGRKFKINKDLESRILASDENNSNPIVLTYTLQVPTQ